MADFKIANQLTKGNEGGLANSSADRGKLTWRGIASAFWPAWAGWPTVLKALADAGNNVAKAEAILLKDAGLQALVDAFYKKNFWDVYGLDQVTDQGIANEMFDTGVNMGVGIESKFLQRALNMTNRSQRLYPDLAVDGAIGAKTIATLNSHPDKRLVLKILNVLQGARYISLLEADTTQEVFAESWFSRVTL